MERVPQNLPPAIPFKTTLLISAGAMLFGFSVNIALEALGAPVEPQPVPRVLIAIHPILHVGKANPIS